MRTFVYSLYFYTILGGFLIIVALINLLRGYYIEDLVGYVLLFPAALLAVFLSVNLKSLNIKRNKFNMSFLPFLLFLSWSLLTAVLGSTYQNGFNQLILYMAFFSAIPYLLGLIISNKTCYVRYRWSVAIFLILLVLGLASVISKWHDLTYGRYRVTGFAEIGANSFGLILGVYALVVLNNVFSSSRLSISKFVFGAVLTMLVAGIIFFAGSMGNIISLCLTAFLLMYINKRLRKRIAVLVIFVACIGYVLIGYFGFVVNKTLISGAENIGKYTRSIDSVKKGEFSNIGGQRFFYIKQYMQRFYDNPIMGNGFGSRDGLRCDPHNFLIELLGETGLISLLLFAWILYYPLRSSFHILRGQGMHSVYTLSAIMLIASVFSALFSGSIFIHSILWFLIGVMPYYNTNKPRLSRLCRLKGNFEPGFEKHFSNRGDLQLYAGL